MTLGRLRALSACKCIFVTIPKLNLSSTNLVIGKMVDIRGGPTGMSGDRASATAVGSARHPELPEDDGRKKP